MGICVWLVHSRHRHSGRGRPETGRSKPVVCRIIPGSVGEKSLSLSLSPRDGSSFDILVSTVKIISSSYLSILSSSHARISATLDHRIDTSSLQSRFVTYAGLFNQVQVISRGKVTTVVDHRDKPIVTPSFHGTSIRCINSTNPLKTLRSFGGTRPYLQKCSPSHSLIISTTS